jgi:hypothetical protein
MALQRAEKKEETGDRRIGARGRHIPFCLYENVIRRGKKKA